ncbi:RsmE family RNA methyltransferase [candidate division GN15 bacterium]|nr:RsmE family RNA methyltransferase [candidate division GN15 bacterium]
MNLMLLLPDDQVSESRYKLSDERAAHICSVLGSKTGDLIEVGLLNGPIGKAEIVSMGQTVELETRELHQPPSPEPTIDLVCALPRPQTLKRVLATCGTMAIRRLHLIRANRVERSYYQSPLLQTENYTRFLIEGMMQGRQTRMTEVTIHERFRLFFEDKLPGLVSDQDERPMMLAAEGDAWNVVADAWDETPDWIIAAVGPEGGWVPFELDTMRSAGFQIVSLGRWVLRVEAAVVALLSQIEMQVQHNKPGQ